MPLKLIVDKINPPPPPPPDDNGGSLPGWALAIIVIGSLAATAGIGFIVYTKFIKAKAPNREILTEKSQSLLGTEINESEVRPAIAIDVSLKEETITYENDG